jgi:fumarate reductase subunit C
MDKYYIIVVVLFAISFLIIRKTFNPKNDAVNRGYGSEKESIKTLMDRAQWSNHYTGRIPSCARFLLFSIFLTFAANIVFTGGKASGKTFMQAVIVIWIALIMLSSYFSHHADKFSSYCVDRNLNNIRKKLNIEQYDHKNASEYLSVNKNRVTGTHGCFTFFYNVK